MYKDVKSLIILIPFSNLFASVEPRAEMLTLWNTKAKIHMKCIAHFKKSSKVLI